MSNAIIYAFSNDLMMNINETFQTPEYAETNRWMTFTSVFILVIATLIGTGGNILIVLSIAVFRNLRYEESVFFLNLALSDLYVTVVVDPMSAIGK